MSGFSSPIRPVQGAVLDGLAEMPWLDTFDAVKVSDRAGYFQNAVVGPRG